MPEDRIFLTLGKILQLIKGPSCLLNQNVTETSEFSAITAWAKMEAPVAKNRVPSCFGTEISNSEPYFRFTADAPCFNLCRCSGAKFLLQRSPGSIYARIVERWNHLAVVKMMRMVCSPFRLGDLDSYSLGEVPSLRSPLRAPPSSASAAAWPSLTSGRIAYSMLSFPFTRRE